MLLQLDASGFQEKLERKEFNSQALVSFILEHIESHNTKGLNLRAMTFLAPKDKLLKRAKILDQERAKGKCRATSPDLGLNTSAGSHAVLKAGVIRNAPIVDKLIEKGAIIIGKTNLSEFCAFKGEGLIDGFSPVGKQTISPYVYEGLNLEEGELSPSSPGGSSTGSAVSVSAGFALIGIGTETDGSVAQPSSRQALYALKPTLGSINAEGCWRVSKTRDIPGVMAKSTGDIANILDILIDPTLGDLKNPSLFRFPPSLWTPSDEAIKQHDGAYINAISTIRQSGAVVKYPVRLTPPAELSLNGEWTLATVMSYEHEAVANDFLKHYTHKEAGIRTLADIIQFNKENQTLGLPKDAPNQSWLIDAVENRPTEEAYRKAIEHMTRVAKEEGLKKTMKDYGLDVVVAPMDSPICSLSCASGRDVIRIIWATTNTIIGYPIATVPLGRYKLKGELSRPFGLAILAEEHQESVLIRFMSAFESVFREREIPERLLGRNIKY
ncbi:hypothetical protein Daesc_005634 [Daldinia eschscholtzii]|uniref:Amidase domain-containing protein n=1 Tax=Daldinia eschscholtzii TaxID=292717 RepID=A0AAX6MMB9_9PEZI